MSKYLPLTLIKIVDVGDGEPSFCNQKKGNIQFFDDPCRGEHIYFGLVITEGDQYYFPASKHDIPHSNWFPNMESNLREIYDHFVSQGVFKESNPKLQMIAFAEAW